MNKIINSKVVINSKSSQKWADISGVKKDLCRALDCCDRALKTPDLSLKDYLLSAALNYYNRCFLTGVRERIDDSIFPDEDGLDGHKELKKYRDRHIVHPVSDYERNYAEIYITSNENNNLSFEGRILHRSKIAVSNDPIIGSTLDHIKHVIALVDSLLRNLEKEVINELNEFTQSELMELEKFEDIEKMDLSKKMNSKNK